MFGTNRSYGELMAEDRRYEAQSNRQAFIRYITHKPNHKSKHGHKK